MTVQLYAYLAKTPLEHLAAENLCHQVLEKELGTRLAPPANIEISEDNAYCQHILVQTEQGRTIASARMRTQVLAEMAGGYHSEKYFNFDGFPVRLEGNILELDQLCTHKSFRQGAALNAIWSTLSNIVADYHIDHLLLLVPLVKTQLSAPYVLQNMVPPHLRITPYHPLCLSNQEDSIPSTLKLLIDLGARFCGEPAWDEQGGCGHALMLLNTNQTPIPMLYSKTL